MSKLSRDMTQGSVAWNLIVFSLPLCLSYFLQALYGSADTLIVGQFSALGDVTGVSQGSQVINILTQGISGLSSGGTVLIARYMGAKREEDLQQTIETLFSLFALSALALTGIMLLGNNLIIRLMQVPAEAVLPMRRYLQVCEIGILFIFFYNCISAVLQAMGDSRHPLIFVGIACCVNIVLDLILVAGFRMGALGAAIATVSAQMFSVVLSIRFLRKQQFGFDFSLGSFRISREKLRLLLELGLPFAIMRTVVHCSFVIVSGLSNVYGLAASSAAGVVAKINTFATMPFTALQVAVSTMAGQNMGAGQLKRAQHTLLVGLGISFSIGSAMFLLAQCFPRQMLGIFSQDLSMINAGENFLRCFSLEYLFMSFTYCIHGLMSACGYTWIPALDGFLASVVCRIPLAVLFSRWIGFPGIALGSSVAVLGAMIPAICFYLSGIWRKAADKNRL